MSGASTAENFAVRLLAGAREHPDRIAIRQGTVRISYGLLARRVRKLAGALRDDGVGPGDRVALLFPNDHRFIEALLATVWLGAVAVPLNTRAGTAALDYVMADATPRVLLGHVSLRERADGLAEPANVPVILADEQQWHGLAADSMHQEAVAEAGAAAQAQPDESSGPGAGDAAAPVAETDVCFQPYTSGSTGNPKGCLLSHGGQYWNAATVAEVWQLRDDDRGLVTAPLYHKNALICVVKPLLLVGGTIVIGRSSDPRTIPAEVAEHGCTYTTGVPATYEMLLASGEQHRHDLSSLRFVICGSAPLSESVGRSFAAELGAPVLEAYGLTEGGPQVLMNPRDAEPRYGLAGRPLPGAEARLLQVQETPAGPVSEEPEVPIGAVGEMWIRNPGVTAGYYHLPEVTARRISSDGWLRTGDLAQEQPDGYYRVLGRADDMMNVGGENVYPLEVEKLLRTMPQVSQAAVVAAPHARKGQAPVAFVVADGIDEQQVRSYALDHGAPHAHPRRVWFLDQLPLGGTGKVDTSQLEALARENLHGRALGEEPPTGQAAGEDASGEEAPGEDTETEND